MPALKCPNPSCPFLFDPTQVPPGAILTCPRCGMRFTLGPSPAYPTPPAHAQATQPAFPAPALPGPPTASGAPTVMATRLGTEEPAEEEPRPRDRRGREPARPARKSGGGFGVVVALGAGFLLLGMIAAAFVVAGWVTGRTGGGPGGELRVDDKNFAYRFPGPPWEKDADTQNALNVHAFALHRTDPDAWAALEVADYGKRSPTAAELREKMADQLGRVFADLTPGEFEPATWAGHEARRCQFRGRQKSTDTICAGECYALAFKGVGYWFYTWAGEREAAAVADQFEELRGRFRTLDQRENWADRAAPEVVFRSDSGKYRLSCREEKVWAKPPGLVPTDEDPKADLLLRGELRGRQKRDFNPEAKLVVLVLKQAGDPAAVAKEYVRKRHSPDPEVFGPTQITELTGPPAGDEPPGADGEAIPTTRLKVSPGGANASKSAEKLVVYAAIRADDEVIVAEGSCPWSQREAWERRLVQFVGSLRP